MSAETATNAVAMARDVQAGRCSAQAMAQQALDRALAVNPRLNALTCLNPDLLAEARAVDARLASGAVLPLAGVPVVIKDNIWVRGLTITNGSRLFEGFVPPVDAICVTRLRAAGAVILGIGACSEFACKGVTNTPLHGITRHPMDPALTPGGSSGGPAVAVAAGIVPVAIGTDAGGSSRRPPAHVGVIGFKPGQDVVPYGPGFAEPVWGISTICPITRDVADATLVHAVLSGAPTDTPAVPMRPRNGRIAYARDMGLGVAMDAQVAQVCDAAVAALTQDTPITRAAPVWQDNCLPATVMPLQFSGLAALYGDHWRRHPGDMDPDIGAQIETGLALTGVEVALAHQASQAMRQTLRDFLTGSDQTGSDQTGHDMLITATTPCTAWPATRLGPALIGGRPAQPRDHAAFTPQANHAGLPAITLPCGFTDTGLPVGLQIIAGPGGDGALLAFARQVETTLCNAGLTLVDTLVSV